MYYRGTALRLCVLAVPGVARRWMAVPALGPRRLRAEPCIFPVPPTMQCNAIAPDDAKRCIERIGRRSANAWPSQIRQDEAVNADFLVARMRATRHLDKYLLGIIA